MTFQQILQVYDQGHTGIIGLIMNKTESRLNAFFKLRHYTIFKKNISIV